MRRDVGSDVHPTSAGAGDQVDRLDRLPEVVDPVEASDDVVHRQTERFV